MGAYQPSMRDEAVKAKTGKTWDQWFRALDKAGAKKMVHKDIARHLSDEHGIPGWWCQMVTVEYERSRGLREVGMKSSGDFEVTAQRTVDLPLGELKKLWTDARRRGSWLADARLKAAFTKGARSARTSKTVMGDMFRVPLAIDDGAAQLVTLQFSTNAKGKAVVNLQHTKIPTKADRERLKAAWKVALDAMSAKAATVS